MTALLLAAFRCGPKTTSATLLTPTPAAAVSSPDLPPSPGLTPMPVVTAAAFPYDQKPGVLYEQKDPTSRPTQRPVSLTRTTLPAGLRPQAFASRTTAERF